eukprot:8860219-Karenia_brevis.AAC.1
MSKALRKRLRAPKWRVPRHCSMCSGRSPVGPGALSGAKCTCGMRGQSPCPCSVAKNMYMSASGPLWL